MEIIFKNKENNDKKQGQVNEKNRKISFNKSNPMKYKNGHISKDNDE